MSQTTEKQERALNEAAYRQLKEVIRETYPHGHFVALRGGRIVADAATFEEVYALVEALGGDSVRAFVVQAGIDYPDYVDLFVQEARQ